jgi:hypothetical protein
MTRRRKKHRPEEVVAKLRDADAMLNAGKDLAAVLQALEVSETSSGLCSSFSPVPCFESFEVEIAKHELNDQTGVNSRNKPFIPSQKDKHRQKSHEGHPYPRPRVAVR